eukprot:c3020_g1_i1.p1 GENE.c3020_g1_i1~~c3020_g1_i1.p1  ORF type:complete len:449 (+),score=90.50 c3020_g1_i1:106-1347(+)
MLNQAKNQAISYIFHEVRNPVNVISMATDVALTSMSPDDSVFELLQSIRKATELATVVLNDVLNMERLESGTFAFVSVPFNIPEVYGQVIQAIKYQMEQKRIFFDCHIEPSLEGLTVSGDANRLKQVLQNFLSNSSKVTPHNGRVSVEVTQVSSEQSQLDGIVRVRTAVSDTGPGIPEADRGRIFQPWGQLRAGEQHTGSGLGLALCKDFIEKGFGGTISFTSSPSGTTFFFEVDLKILSDGTHDQPFAPPTTFSSFAVTIQSDTHVHVTKEDWVLDTEEDAVDVLVVDDSVMNRRLMMQILKSFGVTCESCENGREAVDLLTGVGDRYVKCRLVLMDKEMPVMDGYAATKALRENSMFRGHIVGITGNALDWQVSEYESHGVDEVITKPVRAERIEVMLRQYGLLGPRNLSE